MVDEIESVARSQPGLRTFLVRNKLKLILVGGDGASIFFGFMFTLMLTPFGTASLSCRPTASFRASSSVGAFATTC